VKRIAFVTLGMAVAIGVVALLAASDVTWAGFAPASCLTEGRHCFNEAVRAGPIKQPANTWSNLAYILAALCIAAPSPGASVAPLSSARNRALYGALVGSIGVFSTLFHASLTLIGEWLDVYCMFLWASYVAVMNLARLVQLGRATWVVAYVVLNALLGIALAVWIRSGGVIFVSLVVSILVTDAFVRRRLRPRVDGRLLALAIATILVSFGIWLLDQNHLLTAPESLLQGHALWHCGAAGTTGWLFLYYASEQPGGTST
jgi:hypothetical protein